MDYWRELGMVYGQTNWQSSAAHSEGFQLPNEIQSFIKIQHECCIFIQPVTPSVRYRHHDYAGHNLEIFTAVSLASRINFQNSIPESPYLAQMFHRSSCDPSCWQSQDCRKLTITSHPTKSPAGPDKTLNHRFYERLAPVG